MTKIFIALSAILITLSSNTSAKASDVLLACKYQYHLWADTENFGNVTKSIQAETENKSLRVDPQSFSLTQDDVADISYIKSGDIAKYTLFQPWLDGYLQFHHSLNTLTGVLEIQTRGQPISDEQLAKFPDADADGYATFSWAYYECAKTKTLF